MEQEEYKHPIFKKNRWYKINNIWYAKFKTIHGSTTYWRFSNKISKTKTFSDVEGQLDNVWKTYTFELLEDLSEIQQYLPEGHIDLIKKEFILPEKWHILITKENLDYFESLPNYTHLSLGTYSSIISIDEGYNTNNLSKDYTEITLDQFKKYVLKEYVNKPEETFKAGEWAYGWHNDTSKYSRKAWKILKINNRYVYPEKNYSTDISDIRKATQEEIQKVTKSKKLNIDELLEEAKRRYPVGAKFKCLHDCQGGPIIEEDYSISKSDKCIRVLKDCGCIYDDGTWAEIISLPETKEFDRNFYVKVNSQEEANQMFDYLESISERVDREWNNYSTNWDHLVYDEGGWMLTCDNNTKKNTIKKPLSDFIKPIKTGGGLMDISVGKSEFKTLPITGQFEWEILNKPNPDHNYQSTTTLKQEPIKLLSFDDAVILFKSTTIKTSNKQLLIND